MCKKEKVIRTKVTEMLGIEYPIIQGCMQWISRAPLVAAVSEAGGLGLLSSSTFSNADDLRKEIQLVKQQTSKPFAVNLTLMPSLVVPDYDGYIRVCAEEGVKVMETAGRPPKPDMVEKIKSSGMTLIHKCTTVKHALKAQSLGADMVVADGFECAGHPGENDIGSMVLTPRCVEELDIPVILAGGVSTGRQMAAARMLGAEGVQCGTIFLSAEECHISQKYKDLVFKAGDISTVVTGKASGHPVRSLKTPLSRKLLQMEGHIETRTLEEIEAMTAGSLRKAVQDGNFQEGTFMSGQIAGLVNEPSTCHTIIQNMVEDAEKRLRGAAALI